MTGLPMVWGGGGVEEVLGGTSEPSAAYRTLAARFRVAAIDRLAPEAMPKTLPGTLGAAPLLLVQPRALAPEELAAFDAWVRGGGSVLILADPMLRRGGPYRPGDPRAPPPMTLLDPLFAHWGLVLDLPTADPGERIERFGATANGRRGTLVTDAAGRWRVTAGTCRVEAGGVIARCRLGAGRAILVADADLVDDSLWEAEAGGDNAALLTGWIDELERGAAAR